MIQPQLSGTVENLEHETLDALQEVVRELDRAVEAVIRQDHDLANAVISTGDAVEQRCALVHMRILAALAHHQAPPDLQALAALLHILRGVQGIVMHCTRIAGLVPGRAFITSELVTLLELVAGAATSTISALWLAGQAFAARDSELAHDAIRAGAELDRRSQAFFRRAFELSALHERRARTMTAFLAMSYLDSVGCIAVDIAEQTMIVANGLFRELADGGPWLAPAASA